MVHSIRCAVNVVDVAALETPIFCHLLLHHNVRKRLLACQWLSSHWTGEASSGEPRFQTLTLVRESIRLTLSWVDTLNEFWSNEKSTKLQPLGPQTVCVRSDTDRTAGLVSPQRWIYRQARVTQRRHRLHLKSRFQEYEGLIVAFARVLQRPRCHESLSGAVQSQSTSGWVQQCERDLSWILHWFLNLNLGLGMIEAVETLWQGHRVWQLSTARHVLPQQ